MSRGQRRFEVEELAAVAAVPIGADLSMLGRRLRRLPETLAALRWELHVARLARHKCAAFLPDDGVPYRVRFARIMRQAVS